MKTKCCNTDQVHVNEESVICINVECENYLGTAHVITNQVKWKNYFVVSVFVFYLLFSFDDFSMENKETKFGLPLKLVSEETPLTIENLETELRAQNIICSREVLAQIKIESGNLNSFLLKRTNNMLGMRYPFSRKTTACGIYIPSKDTVIYGVRNELKGYGKINNYAVYNSWKDAVADYKLWQEACFKVTERYLAFLGNVYAEDSLYTKKIKKVAALADAE